MQSPFEARGARSDSSSVGSLILTIVIVGRLGAVAVDLGGRAGRAVERERRRLFQFRIICPIGTPARPAEPAEGSAQGAGCDVCLLFLEIPAARVHCRRRMRQAGSRCYWPFGLAWAATSGQHEYPRP